MQKMNNLFIVENINENMSAYDEVDVRRLNDTFEIINISDVDSVKIIEVHLNGNAYTVHINDVEKYKKLNKLGIYKMLELCAKTSMFSTDDKSIIESLICNICKHI